MSHEKTREIPVSRPKITLMMLMCGIVGATSVGAASAATPDADVPAVKVRYNPQTLDSPSGARSVYKRIVSAAAEVCPQTDPHFVSAVEKQCRTEAIARAVYKINNPKLVAVYTTSVKKG
jgi:UrcA family protein